MKLQKIILLLIVFTFFTITSSATHENGTFGGYLSDADIQALGYSTDPYCYYGFCRYGSLDGILSGSSMPWVMYIATDMSLTKVEARHTSAFDQSNSVVLDSTNITWMKTVGNYDLYKVVFTSWHCDSPYWCNFLSNAAAFGFYPMNASRRVKYNNSVPHLSVISGQTGQGILQYSIGSSSGLEPPTITSWSNSKTNNNATQFTTSINEAVNYNITVNSPTTLIKWYVDGNYLMGDALGKNTSVYGYAFPDLNFHTISVTAYSNGGTSNTITWSINGATGNLSVRHQNNVSDGIFLNTEILKIISNITGYNPLNEYSIEILDANSVYGWQSGPISQNYTTNINLQSANLISSSWANGLYYVNLLEWEASTRTTHILKTATFNIYSIPPVKPQVVITTNKTKYLQTDVIGWNISWTNYQANYSYFLNMCSAVNTEDCWVIKTSVTNTTTSGTENLNGQNLLGDYILKIWAVNNDNGNQSWLDFPSPSFYIGNFGASIITVTAIDSKTAALVNSANVQAYDYLNGTWSTAIYFNGVTTLSLNKYQRYYLKVNASGYNTGYAYDSSLNPITSDTVSVEVSMISTGTSGAGVATVGFIVSDQATNTTRLSNTVVQLDDGQIKLTNDQGYAEFTVNTSTVYIWKASKENYYAEQGSFNITTATIFNVNLRSKTGNAGLKDYVGSPELKKAAENDILNALYGSVSGLLSLAILATMCFFLSKIKIKW